MMERHVYQVIFHALLLVAFPLMDCSCPNGYISREKTCCKPTICQMGQGFTVCNGTNEEPGEDICFPCPDGTTNWNTINTANMDFAYDVCYKVDCSCLEEAILGNPLDCQQKTEKKRCICDRANFFYGKDPLACKPANNTVREKAMEEGKELTQNGTVEQCRPGYFKPPKNGSICFEHSKCPEGSSVDVPGTNVRDTTCKKNSSTPATATPDPTTTPTPTTTPDPTTTQPTNNTDTNVVGIVVAVVVTLIVGVGVALTVGICAYKKRTGHDRRRDIENEVEGDPLQQDENL